MIWEVSMKSQLGMMKMSRVLVWPPTELQQQPIRSKYSVRWLVSSQSESRMKQQSGHPPLELQALSLSSNSSQSQKLSSLQNQQQGNKNPSASIWINVELDYRRPHKFIRRPEITRVQDFALPGQFRNSKDKKLQQFRAREDGARAINFEDQPPKAKWLGSFEPPNSLTYGFR